MQEYERIAPYGFKTRMMDAANKRLGTENLRTDELAAVAAKRNMTLSEVVAMPELNTYTYNSFYHDGPALVCSSFIIEMWQKSGLFGDLNVNPGEFTPKDLTDLKFYDTNYNHPPECMKDYPDQVWC